MSGNEDFIKDLLAMIEVISTSIEINTREEQFYRRSAEASTREAAKSLFREIAEDISTYRQKLEDRRRKLMDTLLDLQMAKSKKPQIEEVV